MLPLKTGSPKVVLHTGLNVNTVKLGGGAASENGLKLLEQLNWPGKERGWGVTGRVASCCGPTFLEDCAITAARRGGEGDT